MEEENSKQKYLDRLKQMSSHELEKDNGALVVRNDPYFNQSYVESKFGPNDLLAKVERYFKANPTLRISKNRLSIKGDSDHCDHQSNKQNQSNLFSNNLDTEQKVSSVQDLESVISFIKPKQRVINYDPDPKIKFGPPNATSTIKHQQIHSPKQTSERIGVGKKYKISEMGRQKNHGNCSSSSRLPSTPIKNNTGVFSITSSNQELKYKQMQIDEKAKLNLTHCLYLEFVHSHNDEIKNISEILYPKNDYCTNLIKQLPRTTKEPQNNQFVDDKHLTISFDTIIDDESQSTSNSDFIFKPVINLPNSSGAYSLKCFQDGFKTRNVNSIINNKNNYFYQSTPLSLNQPYLTSFDSSSEKMIQKSNNEEESNSEGSFKYYPRKMF